MDVRLPASILLYHVAPFLEDRTTWNALVMVNKELYNLCKEENTVKAPWPQVRLRVTAGRAWSVAFGGDFVACGTERGRIQIWNRRNGTTRVLRDQHKRRVHSTIVIHDMLITGSEDGSLLVWKQQDLSKAYPFSVCKGGVTCMCAWSSDECRGIRIAIACTDRKIRIFQVHEILDEAIECWEDSKFPVIETLHRGPIHAICKTGEFLVSGGSDEQLLAWDLSSSSTDPESPTCSLAAPQHHRVPLPNLGDIRGFAVHKETFAVACGKTVLLYDNSLQQTKVLKGHYSNIRSVAFSHDGDLVASACSDGTIRLWNTSEEVYLDKWESHSSFLVCALAFQGSSMVSVGSDGTIAFWRIPRS